MSLYTFSDSFDADLSAWTQLGTGEYGYPGLYGMSQVVDGKLRSGGDSFVLDSAGEPGDDKFGIQFPTSMLAFLASLEEGQQFVYQEVQMSFVEFVDTHELEGDWIGLYTSQVAGGLFVCTDPAAAPGLNGIFLEYRQVATSFGVHNVHLYLYNGLDILADIVPDDADLWDGAVFKLRAELVAGVVIVTVHVGSVEVFSGVAEGAVGAGVFGAGSSDSGGLKGYCDWDDFVGTAEYVGGGEDDGDSSGSDPSLLRITSACPIRIPVDEPVDFAFEADGAGPYLWSHVWGLLPPGLTFHDDGTITGTPTGQGRYAIRVRVEDA